MYIVERRRGGGGTYPEQDQLVAGKIKVFCVHGLFS